MYYSLKNILKQKAQYNIIIGERSNGKTYAVKEYIIRQFFKDGSQGAIIRRWGEDFKNKRGSVMFADMIPLIKKLSKGKYTDVYFRSMVWYLTNDEKKDIKPFCYGFALSEMEHDKSTSYPLIRNILFDEFLTRGFYLTDEFIIFSNVLSTIIRDRNDVKIFMCGNTVNKYAPYFDEMGLKNIIKQKKGTINLYTYGNSDLRVAVEYCDTSDKKSKKSDVYFAFNNPKLKMIKSGEWEIDNYPHLPRKYIPSEIMFTFFIIFNQDVLQCEVISNNDLFIYIHKKTTEIKNNDKDLIYDLNYHSEYNKRYTFTDNIDKIDNKIYTLYKSNKFFYQNNDVGEIVNNFIKTGMMK